MSNPLAAAIEALELAAQKFEILAAAGVELTDGVCPKYSYQEARDAARSARTALAEAEGSVNLPVRWVEQGGSLQSTQLFLGDCYVGCFFDNDGGGVFVEYEPDEVIWAKHVADPDTAKAALLAAVRGDAT